MYDWILAVNVSTNTIAMEIALMQDELFYAIDKITAFVLLFRFLDVHFCIEMQIKTLHPFLIAFVKWLRGKIFTSIRPSLNSSSKWQMESNQVRIKLFKQFDRFRRQKMERATSSAQLYDSVNIFVKFCLSKYFCATIRRMKKLKIVL